MHVPMSMCKFNTTSACYYMKHLTSSQHSQHYSQRSPLGLQKLCFERSRTQ